MFKVISNNEGYDIVAPDGTVVAEVQCLSEAIECAEEWERASVEEEVVRAERKAGWDPRP